MDLETKKKKRFEFLKALYNTVDGSSQSYVNMWELGEEIEFDRVFTTGIVEYLVAEGLIAHFSMGGNIVITHQGVLEIEEALSNPEKATEHFAPINIINVENMNNSAIQQGNANSSQTVIFESNDIDKLKDLIKMLEESISQFAVSELEKEELTSEVETLKSQSNSPKPKKVIIHESLKTIRNIVEGVSIGAATPVILELIKSLTT